MEDSQEHPSQPPPLPPVGGSRREPAGLSTQRHAPRPFSFSGEAQIIQLKGGTRRGH